LVILLNLRDTHPDLRRSKSRLTSARLVLSEMLWLIIRLFMDPPWCNSGTIHVTIEMYENSDFNSQGGSAGLERSLGT